MNNQRHKNLIGAQLLRSTSRQAGRIISVTAQGDKVYAIVRQHDKVGRDENGKEVVIKGGIIGNLANLPEDELTLAEVLIDTDIDFSANYSEIDQYIGRDVVVEMLNGFPYKVITQTLESEARRIPKREIWTARNLSPDRTLTHANAKKYLKNAGYSDKEIESVTGETIKSVNPEGYELTYGDAASWNRAVPPKATTAKDISDKVETKLVSGLPATKLERKRCYRPAKALTAR